MFLEIEIVVVKWDADLEILSIVSSLHLDRIL